MKLILYIQQFYYWCFNQWEIYNKAKSGVLYLHRCEYCKKKFLFEKIDNTPLEEILHRCNKCI